MSGGPSSGADRSAPDDRSGAAERRSFIRQSGMTSIAAALSAASGMVVQVVIAATFGAGAATDAFFVAARIPLAVVQVLLVLASQALVPTFSQWLSRTGPRRTWRRVSAFATTTMLGGLALSALAAVLSGPLTSVIAPGLAPSEQVLAARLIGIAFLIVPLNATAEVLRAALNARYSFVTPITAHVIMNVVVAGVVIGFAGRGVAAAAVGYVVGSCVQLIVIVIAAYRQGFRYTPGLRLRDPEIVATWRLCVRPAIGAALVPTTRIGEQMVASYLPIGSITIINYGVLLINAVGGIFFRSIAVTLVPRLSDAVAGDRDEDGRRALRLGLRLMIVVSVPLTAVAAVLAAPAVQLVFRRGNFTQQDAVLLGGTLAVYALSLAGSGVQRVLLAPFYALLETLTPLRNALYGVLTNLLLLPVLVIPFAGRPEAVYGVALAYTVAQYVNVGHAWVRLRGVVLLRFADVRSLTVRLLALSVAAAIAMAVVVSALDGVVPGLVVVVTAGAAGTALLAAGLALLASDEVQSARQALRRGPTAAPADAPRTITGATTPPTAARGDPPGAPGGGTEDLR